MSELRRLAENATEQLSDAIAACESLKIAALPVLSATAAVTAIELEAAWDHLYAASEAFEHLADVLR